MGSGVWTTTSFSNYTTATKGMSMDAFTTTSNMSAQEVYKSRKLSPVLNPYNVMRECHDSDEHPNTYPVILALDVTGSMGGASVKVAQKLNEIMTDIYADDSIRDVEFCIMGIGDTYCDRAPIQISQFESDIRIAQQLDEIYFEACGGGNSYESYTAAWYMGVNHCDLDCWKRGKKGLIITLGDENPNPVLEASTWRAGGGLAQVTGDKLQGDIETRDLLPQAKEKFNLYHISINDEETSYEWHNRGGQLDKKWIDLLGENNYKVANLNSLAKTIVQIVKDNNPNNNGFDINNCVVGIDLAHEENNEVIW